jgi:TonB family protein
MKEFGLHIAAIASLVFHSLIIIILSIVIKRNVQYLEPKVYTVNIFTPSADISTPKAETLKDTKALDIPAKPKLVEPEPKKIIKEKTPIKEVIKEVTSEERIEQLKELMKKKKQSSEPSIEATKNVQLQKIRAISGIRKNFIGISTVEKNQTVYSDSNSPVMKEQGERYYDNVRNYIMGFWSYPDMGKKTMLAIISFKVDISGNISNIKIEQSSGDSLYDSQARYAVIKSNPLPKPPFSMELGIRFTQ